MQVEFLHSRLMQLKERIDDTEDLINIELDQRRNELVGYPTSPVRASVMLHIFSRDWDRGFCRFWPGFTQLNMTKMISPSKTSDEP